MNEKIDYKNGFFRNKDIPANIKTGMAAVMLHATIDIFSSGGKNFFLAMFPEKDTLKSEKENRSNKGTLVFTLGDETSIGVNNLLASIKNLSDLFSGADKILEEIVKGECSMGDEEICEILTDLASKRFGFSEEGKSHNYNEFISPNFDKYSNLVMSHYSGIVDENMFSNLKSLLENVSRTKQANAAQKI